MLLFLLTHVPIGQTRCFVGRATVVDWSDVHKARRTLPLNYPGISLLSVFSDNEINAPKIK